MLKEIYRLVQERLEQANKAKDSACKECAVEELAEVLSIMEEVAFIYDEELV